MLVPLQPTDGDELAREVGRRPALLRAKRERVLLLARDLPACRHVLACLPHRLQREELCEPGVREAPAERRVVEGAVPAREGRVGLRGDERRTAHRLDAAGDEKIPVTCGDRVAGADDGREA